MEKIVWGQNSFLSKNRSRHPRHPQLYVILVKTDEVHGHLNAMVVMSILHGIDSVGCAGRAHGVYIN